MKQTLKIVAAVFGALILMFVLVLAVNSTDEAQTDLTKQMLQKPPRQEGFDLNEFAAPKDQRIPNFDFEKYSDYTANPVKFDDLIQKYQKEIDLSNKAFNQGHILVNPDASIRDGFHVFHSNTHRLYLAYLSRKIKTGHMNEALDMLEKSNKFFVNILETPQTYISKMLALTFLKRNADYTKDLKTEGLLKKTPEALKASFKIERTPVQISKLAAETEFRLSSEMILDPSLVKTFMLSSIFDETPTTPETLLDKAAVWSYRHFMRPNETLNLMSQNRSDITSEKCLNPHSEACEELNEKVLQLSLKDYFVNPVGHALIRFTTPKYFNVISKLQMSTDKLNQTVSEI